jgi:hypothetical protein
MGKGGEITEKGVIQKNKIMRAMETSLTLKRQGA